MECRRRVMKPSLEPELVNKVTDLLTVLSKKDALTIFLLAKDGLNAEADTPQKIGLTRKQYYTRLKQLVDANLIDKSGNAYVHTTLGTFVYQQHILELMAGVKSTKEMKMVDILKRARQFSENDIANFVGKITGVSTARSLLSSYRVIWSWEDMVSTVVERVNFAETEILLASRFTSEIIINAMIMKANAGVDVKVIADTELVKGFLSIASRKLQVLDKNSLERLNVVGNPWYPSGNAKRVYTDIPFSFIIFDCKEAYVELVDSHNVDKFSGCMLVNDERFCQELKTQFNKLWSAASDDLTKLLEAAIADRKQKI